MTKAVSGNEKNTLFSYKNVMKEADIKGKMGSKFEVFCISTKVFIRELIVLYLSLIVYNCV
jgi:hypothetical protein